MKKVYMGLENERLQNVVGKSTARVFLVQNLRMHFFKNLDSVRQNQIGTVTSSTKLVVQNNIAFVPVCRCRL
jgi:hypothetical protein